MFLATALAALYATFITGSVLFSFTVCDGVCLWYFTTGLNIIIGG